ncbi:MAG: CRTAC1 family protein [Verrucomicrobia bacterium]|nr:CRTAC1 family protein [Verrucomicrobiota bacterium]
MNRRVQQALGTVLLAALAGAVLLLWLRGDRGNPAVSPTDPRADARRHSLMAKARWLEARERHVAETAWAKELLAQDCGRTLEALWDALNRATNKLQVLAAFSPGQLVLGQWENRGFFPHAMEQRRASGTGPVLDPDAWRRWVRALEQAGWQLEQAEFRHNRFETDPAGQPRQSVFHVTAHLTHVTRPERAALAGDLTVDWLEPPRGEHLATIGRVDARGLTLTTRPGEPGFKPVLNAVIEPPVRLFSIDPVLVHDLDNDGFAEVLLPSVNQLYRRAPDGTFAPEPLCRFPPGILFTALVADFDGDGTADLLVARADGVVLYRGTPPQGRFDLPEQVVWRPSTPLQNPMAMTAGDIDQDGDLDVFLGQYRVPTLGQVLRPFYYDANDGFPAYLLRNDGAAGFQDVTVAAGLEPNRRRRTYSASLADLDDDGRVDLVVVSDFRGLELYRNLGDGRFAEVTRDWVAESRAFGMAHVFADFNADGHLDLLMIGMNSPAADRLEHLGLTRPDSNEDWTMRARMAYGNRLYLAQPNGGFVQTALNETLARSGWSWGASAPDIDNDGFPDVYIATGHDTQQWVREYEPEFWLHDLYVDETVDDHTATLYFTAKHARTRGQGWSYGGWEKNRLYLNLQAASFLEVAHLLGLALEEDSRNVVAEDLDGDGRQDLIVTTYERWPEVRQTLRIYQNALPDTGHWIGFRFPAGRPGRSAIGTQVRVRWGSQRAVRQVVTGDSHRSQHSSTLHFGLGAANAVEEVEVRWPDGGRRALRHPAIDRYHELRP